MNRQYVFGEFRDGELTDPDVREILAVAGQKVPQMRAVPVADIVDLLDRVSRRWADPADRFRLLAQELLPEQTGFSPAMVRRDLAGFATALSRTFSRKKIAAELGTAEALDGWIRQGRIQPPDPGSPDEPGARSGRGPLVRALSRGVVLHVAAGNVGSIGALSLAEGLLTKNVNILKAASRAPAFSLLFAESLRETDAVGTVSGCVSVLVWSGRAAAHHELFKHHADAIVVWGGETAVREYRDGLGLQAQLIEWGPKVSAGIVARGADLAEAAKAAAADVSMWDQNACSSAQVIYVEGEDRVDEFARRLEVELAAFAERIPVGELGLQEAAEITKTRELAKIDVALGRATLRLPPQTLDWTLIVEKDPTFKLSPLFRTVYVKAVADLADCARHLAPYRASLQTIGLAAPTDRLLELADFLCAAGATRIVEMGASSGGYPGEPHDGTQALQRLVKWVNLDTPELALRRDPVEYLSLRALRDADVARLKEVYRRARHLSGFYRDRLPDLGSGGALDLADTAGFLSRWAELPTLTKAEIQAQVPPSGDGLVCGEEVPMLTLRSGGSSGKPALSLISAADFEADMEAGARGAWAAGLRPGDKVANLFYAGNLYGSFISIQSILERVGCQTYPLATNAPMEDILEVLQAFGVTVLAGLPSFLQTVFDAIAREPGKYRVKKVFYTGEHLYKAERERIRMALGLDTIASIGYGTVDAGPLAYQCEHSAGSIHHVLSGHVWMDILDRQSLRPVDPGEIGEIVVTSLTPRLVPLVRYRIGDLGRVVLEPCACGRRSPRIELLGRADDGVIVGGLFLAFASFQTVVERFGTYAATPQLELSQIDGRDHLVVRIESAGATAIRTLADESPGAVRSTLMAEIPELQRVLSAGMLEGFDVAAVAPGGLQRLGRSGKILHVVDRRRSTGQLV